MRLTTSALTAAVLGTALSATTLIAQQTPPPPDGGLGTSTASIPGMTALRGARYLLRNGWDYLKYQEYERALVFFREAELRKKELNDSERQALVQGIDNARRGMREAGDGSARPAYAGRGPLRRPGAFALAKSPQPAAGAAGADSIQLTSGTRPAAVAPLVSASSPGLPPLPDSPSPRESGQPIAGSPADVELAMAKTKGAAAPSAEPAPAPLSPPPALPEPRAMAPEASAAGTPAPAPAPELAPLDLNSAPLPPLSNSTSPAPSAEPAPLEEPAPVAAPAPTSIPAPTPLPSSAPAQETSPAPVPSTASEAPATELPAPAEVPGPAPALPESLPEVPRVADRSDATEGPSSVPAPAVSDDSPLPPPAENFPSRPEPAPTRGMDSDGFIPNRSSNFSSTLSPDQQREVERIAQKQEDELRAKGPNDRAIPGGAPTDIGGGLSASPGLPSPRLEISRAPSPTEARPIRAIPVPDEFVPLAKREWDPQRKYWDAAAVCHTPLYFQDAALERYGQTVEQAFGPHGRYLTYPVDDPKQSVQRNQVFQPIASIGLFAAQIALLPYNLIMDPPWEAEYDLGYYRPSDRIPPDTIYLPLTGVGPPLRGKRY